MMRDSALATRAGVDSPQIVEKEPTTGRISRQNRRSEAKASLCPAAEARAQEIPKVYRSVYQRAMEGTSRRSAINAFCLGCVDHQREEVRLCTDHACSLFPYRPYK
jgi:hypothetical protein